MQYETMRGAYAGTDLGRLHYKEHAAKGPCVLFLHGLAASTLSFKRLAGELPDTLHVFLLDLLGHGLSDAPHTRYTLETHARAVSGFLDAAKPGPCYVFGHSYGALVAATLVKNGAQPRGLILEDPAGVGGGAADSSLLEAYEYRLVKEALELNPREYVVRDMVHSVIYGEHDVGKTLAGASIPSMLVWGSEDNEFVGGPGTGVESARRLCAGMVNCRFELIQGAGHVPHFTHAKEIASLVSDFTGSKA